MFDIYFQIASLAKKKHRRTGSSAAVSLRRSAMASRLVRFDSSASLSFVIAFVIGRSLAGSRPAVASPETTTVFRDTREMKYQAMPTIRLSYSSFHLSPPTYRNIGRILLLIDVVVVHGAT
jgi:hypothetical protein